MFETCVKLAPFVPIPPLLSFGLLVIFGAKYFKNRLSAFIASAAIGLGLALSTVIFVGITLLGKDLNTHVYNPSIVLFTMGDFTMRVGMAVDNLCGIMLFVVTLVSFLVHVFSTSYMHGDERYTRFFAFLGIFTAAMLGLILSDNFLLLYMSWELVGLASYFLIGFWFEKPSAAKAAVKAFLTTRVGDAGMFLGMATLFGFTLLPKFGGSWATATFNFNEIYAYLLSHQGTIGGGALALALVFTFMGAVGKSAQFPLHIWLPDAMEGPTPVSALIHAATMVAAGVYLVARLFPMFALSSTALMVVALIGGFTALFAATIGLAMYDIKKVLAYSTVSQLGYMIMALGVGGYTAGVFHLMTHAFFKALLFLGSGSVIHSMHHALHDHHELDPQDMRNMGGLAKFMPITYWTFWIGTLALAGIAPFAGFWSKDEILADCIKWGQAGGDLLHWLPYAFGATAAGLTAFYMGRLMFMTFHGKYRGKGHPHESPLAITAPLIVLAFLAATSGLLGVPKHNRFHHLIHYTPPAAVATAHGESAEAEAAPAAHGEHGAAMEASEGSHEAAAEGEKAESGEEGGEGPNWPVMIISSIIAVLGLVMSALFYFTNTLNHEALREKIKPVFTLLNNKYYVDEFVDIVLLKGGWKFISALRAFDMYVVDGIVNFVGWFGKMWSAVSGWKDKWIVDGLVNLVGIAVKTLGSGLRRFQTGYVQNYLFIIALGLLLLLFLRK